MFKFIFYLVEISGGQIKVNQESVKMSINRDMILDQIPKFLDQDPSWQVGSTISRWEITFISSTHTQFSKTVIQIHHKASLKHFWKNK